MSTLPRLTLAAMTAGLLLAGCAHQPAAKKTVVATPSATTSTSSTPAVAASGTQHPHHAVANNGHVSVEDVDTPDRTGIPACDDYLSSYMACHRAAGIFTADQLPKRYQAMRTSLLADSQNPDIRPQLAARCNSLATQLREALHGKSCDTTPAPASSTP